MGTTGRGFPYPAETDTPDVPTHIYNLATSVQSAFDNYDPYAQGLANTALANAKSYTDSSASGLQTQITALAAGAGGWAPTLGGPGATIGNNGGTNGQFVHILGMWMATGRILFGSSASFGTGGAVIQNLPASFDGNNSVGIANYIPSSGQNMVPCHLVLSNNVAMIRPVENLNSGFGFSIGTPAQSDQLVFTIMGVAS